MSFFNNADGTPEAPVCTLLTTGTITTVYTAADNSQVLDTGTFVNPTGTPVDCFLYWRDVTGATDALIWVGTVKAKGVDGPGNLNAAFPVKLNKGDIIKATAANNVWINLLFVKNSRTRPA